MFESEMHVFLLRRLAIVTVKRGIDDLPYWMTRQTIAVDSDGRTIQLLIDPADERRQWEDDPTITVREINPSGDHIPFSFGYKSGKVAVYVDPDRSVFVLVGKPGAFGPRFGGTL